MSTVLFLATAAYGSPGGIQRFNRRLIAALRELAPMHRVHLLHDEPESLPPYAAEVTAFGKKRLAFAGKSLGAARSARVLLLGHLNLLPIGWMARRINPRLKLILFAHGVEVWGDPAYRARRFYEPRLLESVDTIAAVSRHTASRMSDQFAVPQRRFVILPNAVDALAPTADLRPRHTVLAVSRMDKHDRSKNLDTLLRAFAMMPDSVTRLEIVGDGPLRPELEALACALGIAARVRFLGRVSDEMLAACYARAAVFVLPSTKEGFGIVYLEAWQHGVPVICASGAPGEIVSDGVDGFVIDPADIGQLAARMSALLQDPVRAAEMGAAGAAKVRARYLDEHFRRNLASLLETI